MPSLNLTASDARPNRARSLSTSAKAARAAIALVVATVLAAACQPVPSSLPAITTSHVVVPATGLPGAANLVLDAATFDAAAAAACASTPVPQAADFFGGDLAAWAVGSLAGENLSLDQQRARTGATFVSGYAAGQNLHQHYGVQATGGSPFGDLSPFVNVNTTMPALDEVVGHFLLLANADGASAVGSVVGLAPFVVQLHTEVSRDFGVAALPPELRSFLESLVAATSSAATAATAGAAGDVAAARRADTAVAGLLAWAGGYYLGITATTPWPAPTFTC